MCDITKLFGAGSGILGGIGKLVEGFAGEGSHEQGAALARINTGLLDKQAQVAEGGADLATIRGNYDEFLARRKGGQVLSSETAHYAGNNVDASYGSPLAVQGFSASQIENDAQLIRAGAMGARADALTQTANIRGAEVSSAYRASAEDTAARTSRISGVLGAGTSFLSAASKWPGMGDKATPSPSSSGSASSGFTPANVGQYSSRFLAGSNPWGQ